MLDMFEVGAITHQKTNTSSSPIDRRTEKCRRTLLIFLSRPATFIVPVGLPLMHPSSLSVLLCLNIQSPTTFHGIQSRHIKWVQRGMQTYPDFVRNNLYSFPSLRGSHKKEEYLNETNCLEMMDE